MYVFFLWWKGKKNVKGENKESLFDPLKWETLLKDFFFFTCIWFIGKKWLHKRVIEWTQLERGEQRKAMEGGLLFSTHWRKGNCAPNIPKDLGPFWLQSPSHCQATITCAKPTEPQALPTSNGKALHSVRNEGAANSCCLRHFDQRHKSWELRNHSEPQLGGGELINQGNILCNMSLYFFLHHQA